MDYLASERHRAPRRDPRMLFPEVRSIFSFAFGYPAPGSEIPAGAGRVAAYACQSDYHNHLPGLVDEWMQGLATKLGRAIHWRSFSDSAAVLERGLAALAGLGWIGRSGNLLIPGYGSYFLLAEAYCDVDPAELAAIGMAAGHPLPDRCGTCHKCVDACPTGCIRPDRTLDAGRCISYLTIELKGMIPAELSPLLGERVFGCDVCQSVCPWNQHAIGVPAPTGLDLAETLALNRNDFKDVYAQSAMLRAKRRGLVRNCCAAAGNLGLVELAPVLQRLLREDDEALVRASAARALAQMGVHDLGDALAAETDEMVKKELLRGMGKIPG